MPSMEDKAKIIPLYPATESVAGFADSGGVCAEAEPFALMVKGDSMAPEFNDGHIIMVDPSMLPRHGCYVVAQHDGGYIFRRLDIEADKKYLSPLNARYPKQVLSADNAVIGVVTQRSGRRRRDTRKYFA